MFRSRLTPDFARQRAELLAESRVPDIRLPPSVEACVASIASADRPERGLTEARLWLAMIRLIRPLIWRAALVSFLAASCAACSTLIGMSILRGSERGLPTLLGLAAGY